MWIFEKAEMGKEETSAEQVLAMATPTETGVLYEACFLSVTLHHPNIGCPQLEVQQSSLSI